MSESDIDAADDEEWISFKGFKQLAKWMLCTNAGSRFVAWFIRKHYTALLATETVQRFVDWIARQCVPVVIEVNPDGFIRVYATNANVVIVNVPVVQSRAASMLVEEYVSLKLYGRHKAVYGDARRLMVTGMVERITLEDDVAATEERDLVRHLSGKRY